MTDLSNDDLVKAAQEALERPADFGYYGDLPLFHTWGFTFAQHRDSNVLDRSNYRVALRELTEAATKVSDGEPEQYVQVVCSSHWAVGWTDQIAVRIFIDEDGPMAPDNLTPVFVTAAELAFALQDYPVLDDADHSELESEEAEKVFDLNWDDAIRSWDEDDDGPEPTDEDKERVFSQLKDEYGYDPDEWKGDIRDLILELRQTA